VGKKDANSPKDKGRLKVKIKSLAARKRNNDKADDQVRAKPIRRADNGTKPIVVKHLSGGQREEIPDGLPAKFLNKSTFNTHDIMHAPVEKTARMIDDILSGRRLFTM